MKEIVSSLYNTQSKQEPNPTQSIVSLPIRTDGGINLDIGIISEHVGDSDASKSVTQLAVDSIIAYIRNSFETDIPALLYRAIQYANTNIYENEIIGDTECTLAIAAIHNNARLYLANVGTSRVYLLRQTNLSQISLDHTFAHIMPIQEKMSVEEARVDDRADTIALTIGSKKEIPVDIGLHISGIFDKNAYLSAQKRGKIGLPLRTDDIIILGTNHLIQSLNERTSHGLHPDEAVKIMREQFDEETAERLVNSAQENSDSGRLATVLLNLSDEVTGAEEGGFLTQLGQRPNLVTTGMLSFLLVACVIGSFFGFRAWGSRNIDDADGTAVAVVNDPTATPTAEQPTDEPLPTLTPTMDISAVESEPTEAAESEQSAQVNAASTDTDTPTARPTEAATEPSVTETIEPSATPSPEPEEGQSGLEPGMFRLAGESGSSQLIFNQLLTEIQPVVVSLPDLLDSDTENRAYLFALPGSAIEFQNDGTGLLQTELNPGSNLVVEALSRRQPTQFNFTSLDTQLFAQESCIAIDYTHPESTLISCLAGRCDYNTAADETGSLMPGQSAIIGRSGVESISGISADSLEKFQILSIFEESEALFNTCLSQDQIAAVPPTAEPPEPGSETNTPQPSATEAATEPATLTATATETATPTSTATPTATGTATEEPTPTETATATEGVTGSPTPTRTPRPTTVGGATNTPIPPPPTAIPPTNTPVPPPPPTAKPPPRPTNTPVPPPPPTLAPPTAVPPPPATNTPVPLPTQTSPANFVPTSTPVP